MKVHKVSQTDYVRAAKYRHDHGFWNVALTPLTTYCGLEPSWIAWKWRVVTCRRCLARRKKGKKK